MRIAVLNLHVGGMLHYAAGLANSLADRDTVASFGPEEASPRLFDSRVKVFGYPVPQCAALRESRRFLRIGSTLKALRRDLLAWQPDILHVTSGHHLYPLFLPALAARVPTVATLHDVRAHPGESERRVRRKLGLLIRCSRCVLVHTADLRDLAVRTWGLPPDNARVMPFCRFDAFTPWARGRREIPTQILLFGRIRAYKGVGVMLEAMPIVVNRLADAHLVIAGQGNMRPYRDAVRRLAGHVTVRNRFVDDEETAALFETSAVVAAPHLEASQSAIPFVAASFARPVVASRVGGIPDVVDHEHTGLLVPPGDPRALAQAVVRLLTHADQRRAMGEAARKKVASAHGPQAVGSALRAAYARSVSRCALPTCRT